jgi:hypothetical protein
VGKHDAAHAKWRAANPTYFKDRRDQRRLMLNIIKQEMGCIDCGYDTNTVALDFDHVNGNKLFAIGQDILRSIKSIQRELEKCVVRCANCHRIRTFGVQA